MLVWLQDEVMEIIIYILLQHRDEQYVRGGILLTILMTIIRNFFFCLLQISKSSPSVQSGS